MAAERMRAMGDVKAKVAAAASSVVVVMPTYNEKGNLPITLAGVFAHCPNVHVLVVDDNSPDGTGELADQMAAADGPGRLHVLHRQEKNGLGPAYLAGFAWALDHGYELICEMDMDGSHRPVDLARLLKAAQQPISMGGGRQRSRMLPDLVIGSRRVLGGRSMNWPWYRDLISSCGSWYARLMLGLDVHDVTAGFRVYRASLLRRLNLKTIEANGYVFQIDMTRQVAAAGGVIREVPIEFVERTLGKSKMSGDIVREAMLRVTQWGVHRRFGRVKITI